MAGRRPRIATIQIMKTASVASASSADHQRARNADANQACTSKIALAETQTVPMIGHLWEMLLVRWGRNRSMPRAATPAAVAVMPARKYEAQQT
jgi:hypothetical protein